MAGRSQLRSRWTRLNAPLAASGLATGVCCLLVAMHLSQCAPIPGLASLESSSEDVRAQIAGTRSPVDDRIVIVAFDDKTRARDPDLVQNRRGLARLVDAIAVHRPTAVGVDMFYSQPELNLDPEVVTRVTRALQDVNLALALIPEGDSPERAVLAGAGSALDAVLEQTRGDQILAKSLTDAGAFYFAVLFHLDDKGAGKVAERPAVGRARISEAVTVETSTGRHPPRARSVSTSMPAIALAARAGGFVNASPDPDGALRSLPMVIEHGGRYYQSMSMALAAAAVGGDQPAPTRLITGASEVQIGPLRIPTDPRGRATLSYLGPSGTFPHLSASDVAAGTVAPGALTDKIVLIGYTEAARDKIVQPFDRVASGVEVHATAIHNFLHGEVKRRPRPTTAIWFVLLFGTVITLVQLRRIRQGRGWVVGAAAVTLGLGHLVLAHLLYSHGNLILPVVAPILGMLAVTATALSVGIATEGREKALLRSVFSRYVQQSVVDQILVNPDQLRLGGQRRELSVLFSDIRGFSKISEELEPEVLTEYLNQYLTPMTDIVQREGGMLDKYIGDALMAVYGAPLAASDHAQRACRTALAMRVELAVLNVDLVARGLPEVDIGIGINSGPMSVGNMGSQARFDYTVVGDAVNVGSRLESLTRIYQVPILAGAGTAAEAKGEFVFRELDTAKVMGRSGSAPIYELVGTDKDSAYDAEALALFAQGLGAYREQSWDQASEHFSAFLSRYPDDGPSAMFLTRIEGLRRDPPGDDWDGVYEQRTK